MIRNLFQRSSVLLPALIIAAVACTTKSPADYVNPFIGASTSVDAAGVYHGLGKTFPGATTPFGMVQVSPQTITGGDNASGYSYEMKTIEGFSFTQMSGTGWFGDLGNFLVMPTIGPMKTIAGVEGGVDGWRSAYDKAGETATPGYYSATLSDYGIKVECTATPHCGMMRFTWPENEASRIQVDFARRVGGCSEEQEVSIVGDRTIEGWMRCTPETGGWGNGDGHALYTVYFHAEFDRPFADRGFWSADIPDGQVRKRDEVVSEPYLELVSRSQIIKDAESLRGKHLGFFTEFPTGSGETSLLKVGISFVDLDGARKNFEQEMAGKGFDEVREEALGQWNRELNKVKVCGGSEAERTVLYTALYHTMIDPRIYADCDGRYTGGDYQVHPGEGDWTKRTIFSGWDIFRSQVPLQSIINPQVVDDIIASLVSMADESGRDYLERWEFLNSYSGCMVGNPALPVIADAYINGIRNFDTEKAFEYAANSSDLSPNRPLGWTPNGIGVSETLEYAYADWCLGRFAEAIGKDGSLYYERAQDYRNTFDSEEAHWFRRRHEDGSWGRWPEGARTMEGLGCIESNPYQQGWFVPHDIPGMVELMGGREAVLEDLESFFENTPDNLMWNQYYNHANEPVHFVPFLFNVLGQPWNTQKWTRFICAHAYSDDPSTGLVGNDDCGQMSAWYILAAAGLHPVCPADGKMQITSPVFDRIELQTDPAYASGKPFVVVAKKNSPKNIYIQSAKLNGKTLGRCWLDFSEISAGGKLELTMGPEPSNWGIE